MSADDVAADDVLARVLLGRLAEPGDPAFGGWIAQTGAVEALADLRAGRCPLRGRDAYLARLRADDRPDPAAVLDAAAAIGMHVVVPGTEGWPTQLDDLAERSPLALWVRGPASLRESVLCSVAVVGARAATAYGEAVAAELAADVAAERWAVVSGGAYGIDAAAHAGALAVDGLTVAVLAGGADQFHPRMNDALLARIADTGLVVSELPPGSRPSRSRFLERNRLVAALTRATVVVEAAARSGALSTAARAADLNRPVAAVPGPITSGASAGCHRLVRDQAAVLVRGAADVLDLVRPLGAGAVDESEHGDVRPHDALDPALRSVHDALAPRRARPADALAVDAGVPPGAVLGLLGELRDLGLAERVDGGWRLGRPLRPG